MFVGTASVVVKVSVSVLVPEIAYTVVVATGWKTAVVVSVVVSVVVVARPGAGDGPKFAVKGIGASLAAAPAKVTVS